MFNKNQYEVLKCCHWGLKQQKILKFNGILSYLDYYLCLWCLNWKTVLSTYLWIRQRVARSPPLHVQCRCLAKFCGDARSAQLIFHPGCDTLSPSCKSRTSLGTMGSGATELLGLLKGGSPFIWEHYNSTKACGCLHTERAQDEWAALTPLTPLATKAPDRQREEAVMCGLGAQTWGECRRKMTKQPY